LSDSKGEKLYHDAEEFESFRIEDPVLVSRLQALLVHLDITTAPKYLIKGLPRSGRVEFWAIMEIFHGSKVVSRHMRQPLEHLTMMMWLTPHGGPSLLGVIATTTSYKTQSITSCLNERRTCLRLLL
jgi:hypothetical protein